MVYQPMDGLAFTCLTNVVPPCSCWSVQATEALPHSLSFTAPQPATVRSARNTLSSLFSLLTSILPSGVSPGITSQGSLPYLP